MIYNKSKTVFRNLLYGTMTILCYNQNSDRKCEGVYKTL